MGATLRNDLYPSPEQRVYAMRTSSEKHARNAMSMGSVATSQVFGQVCKPKTNQEHPHVPYMCGLVTMMVFLGARHLKHGVCGFMYVRMYVGMYVGNVYLD